MDPASLLELLGAPWVWFLGSLGALLEGLEFIGAATLGLLALDPTDSMLLKDVFSGIHGFGLPRGFEMELRNSVTAWLEGLS